MTIISQGYVCDGYDVTIDFGNGFISTLHFGKQPSQVELDDIVLRQEQRMINEIVLEKFSEEEESDVI